MGRPVIVDDGGSIRIMWKQDRPGNHPAGKMDGLLDVEESGGQWRSKTPIEAKGQDCKYDKAVIAWVTESGEVGTQPYEDFENIIVSTDLNLNVELTRDPNSKKLEIKVRRDVDEPIIESKYINRKCGYTVVNGGGINQITCDGVSPNIQSPTVYIGVTIT
jgi:hypothetical protein